MEGAAIASLLCRAQGVPTQSDGMREHPTCVRGGGPPGRFDGLQRPECGQEIAGPGLAALRGDADVLNVVC
jgi:hypothetical protein